MPLIANSTAPTPYSQIQSVSLSAFNMLLNAFVLSMTRVWKSSTPQAVITEMGADAKNNFAASAATATYLTTFSELSFSPTDHTANLVKIGVAVALAQPYTVNDDGTITVNPPVAPVAPAAS